MIKKTTQHYMEWLVALLLFGIFAVCVLIVLLTGADAYRGLTQRDRDAYLRRTCTQYIATRVRQADSLGDIAVEPFGEGNALAIAEGEYHTLVYCYEGWLMELYCGIEAELEPEDGERLLEMKGLDFYLEEGVLTAVIGVDEETEDTLRLCLRSGRGSGI
ncbi:hypothetical protein IMSAG049_01683 [Clostridiales bacterium]|nr:hypothetical protein IMSAG049_01683 [Clostridiales bacterium]